MTRSPRHRVDFLSMPYVMTRAVPCPDCETAVRVDMRMSLVQLCAHGRLTCPVCGCKARIAAVTPFRVNGRLLAGACRVRVDR